MRKYETLEIKVKIFFGQDIITNSPNENSSNEAADDLSGWNREWF